MSSIRKRKVELKYALYHVHFNAKLERQVQEYVFPIVPAIPIQPIEYRVLRKKDSIEVGVYSSWEEAQEVVNRAKAQKKAALEII